VPARILKIREPRFARPTFLIPRFGSLDRSFVSGLPLRVAFCLARPSQQPCTVVGGSAYRLGTSSCLKCAITHLIQASAMPHLTPTFFISQGGGPWPWMPRKQHGACDALAACLIARPAQIGRTPTALLVISGHWQADECTVMSSPKPPMIYHDTGFPARIDRVSCAAPGPPSVVNYCRAHACADRSSRL